jgi:hypothetical protein
MLLTGFRASPGLWGRLATCALQLLHQQPQHQAWLPQGSISLHTAQPAAAGDTHLAQVSGSGDAEASKGSEDGSSSGGESQGAASSTNSSFRGSTSARSGKGFMSSGRIDVGSRGGGGGGGAQRGSSQAAPWSQRKVRFFNAALCPAATQLRYTGLGAVG